MRTSTERKRLSYLEAARGVAAIIVVFHHFLLGFIPVLKAPVMQGGLQGTPLYCLVNGTGAVYFFFTLSGFVLTLKFYQHFSVSDITAAVLKRLPRLMLPAGLSMMIGAAILIYLPDAHRAAARLSGSDWLVSFAAAGFADDFVPSFTQATRDSLLVFLWPGHHQYNSNLWTMFYEFYGSLIVFTLVAVCSVFLRQRRWAVVVLHVLLILVCLALHQLKFSPFLVGSLIAFFHCRCPKLFLLSTWPMAVLIFATIAGYSVNYGPALVVASTAAMLLLLCSPSLERRLGGPVGLFLGRLSFPLYLVHVLVILSVTSAVYTTLLGHGLWRGFVLALCLVLTWLVSLLAALPFMALERAWVPALNRGTRALIRRFDHAG